MGKKKAAVKRTTFADVCRENNWNVGQLLACKDAMYVHHYRITAIGERLVCLRELGASMGDRLAFEGSDEIATTNGNGMVAVDKLPWSVVTVKEGTE